MLICTVGKLTVVYILLFNSFLYEQDSTIFLTKLMGNLQI